MTPELLQEGVWRIPLRMRTQPPFVNVYAVRGEDGWLLIDSGPPGEETWAALVESLAGCGIRPEEIETLVLTHGHPDHTGQVEALRKVGRMRVWLHEEDAAMLAELAEGAPEILPVLRAAGTPEEQWAEVEAAHRRLAGHFRRIAETLPLREGTEFDTRAGRLRAVHTPGHAPGHCCLFGGGLMFSGDHVLPDTLPHAGFIPGRDTLGDYLGTLPRLKELAVERVLPSHGLPFAEWRAWLERAEATHRRRLSRVAALRAEGRTPHEMVMRMWPRELRPVDYQLALTRVLGYLRHLDAAPDSGTTGESNA